MKRSFVVVGLLLLGAGTLSAAEPEKAKEGAKGTTIKIKATTAASATTIDFRKELGLPFESLAWLGGRIERCRIDADPVGLVACAQELQAAEKVAGKQGSLTAGALTAESTELAKMRNDSKELAAVALLAPAQAAELNKLAKAAAIQEEDAASAAKSGEEPKGIHSALEVHNHADVHVNVYVNGRYVGHVEAYGSRHFHLHVDGFVSLDARGPFGHRWHRDVHEDYDTYTFELVE